MEAIQMHSNESCVYLHDPLVPREGDGKVSESVTLKERSESFLRTRQLTLPWLSVAFGSSAFRFLAFGSHRGQSEGDGMVLIFICWSVRVILAWWRNACVIWWDWYGDRVACTHNIPCAITKRHQFINRSTDCYGGYVCLIAYVENWKTYWL